MNQKREKTRIKKRGLSAHFVHPGPCHLLDCRPGQGLGSPQTAAGQRESTYPPFWQDHSSWQRKLLFPNKYKLERFFFKHPHCLLGVGEGSKCRSRSWTALSCNKRPVVWGNASHPFTTRNLQHDISLQLSESRSTRFLPYPRGSSQVPHMTL